jgi:hypothetical protein
MGGKPPPGNAVSEISIEDKIAELNRELAMRHKVYPRLVLQGNMRGSDADRRIAIIKAIIKDYERQVQPALFETTP